MAALEPEKEEVEEETEVEQVERPPFFTLKAVKAIEANLSE